jgi:hypothetical protein
MSGSFPNPDDRIFRCYLCKTDEHPREECPVRARGAVVSVKIAMSNNVLAKIKDVKGTDLLHTLNDLKAMFLEGAHPRGVKELKGKYKSALDVPDVKYEACSVSDTLHLLFIRTDLPPTMLDTWIEEKACDRLVFLDVVKHDEQTVEHARGGKSSGFSTAVKPWFTHD